MDDDERARVQELRTTHERRLQKLELIQAREGRNTQPEILNEIEDIQRELRRLGARETPVATRPDPMQRQRDLEIALLAQLNQPGTDLKRESLAAALGVDVEELMDLAQILSEKGWLRPYMSQDTLSASLTAEGRAALRRHRPPA